MLVSSLDTCSGDVRVAGTRMTAEIVASMVLGGFPIQDIMDDYGLEEHEIHECVAYYEYGGVVDVSKYLNKYGGE